MKPTNDDLDPKLDELLRSLPREQAPPRLAPRVLARMRRAPISRRPRLATAAAFALAVVAMVTVAPQVLEYPSSRRDGHHDRASSEPMPSTAAPDSRASAKARRIQALESEYQQLRAELSALQRLHAAARPVVYLGGTEQADYVLDLGRLARHQPGAWPTQHSRARDGQAQRAVFSTGGSTP